MRKLLLLVVLLLSSAMMASAQDIILKRDNDIIRGRVTSVSDTYLLYKSENNPDGPDYRIPIADIARVVYEDGTETVFGAGASSLSGSVALVYDPSPDMTPEEVVQELYAIFDAYLVALGNVDTNASEREGQKIRILYDSRNAETKKAINKILTRDIASSYQTGKMKDVLFCVERALCIFPLDYQARFQLLLALGDIYSAMENKEGLWDLTKEIQAYPGVPDSEKAEALQRFVDRANSLKTFNETLSGYWICNKKAESNYNYVKNRPLLIVNFGDPFFKAGSGLELLSEYSGIYNGELPFELRRPIGSVTDPVSKTFVMNFSSSKDRQGNYQAAQEAINMDREMQSMLYASRQSAMRSTSVSMGDYLKFSAATAAISVGSTVLSNVLANALATSYLSVDQMILQGTRVNSDMISTHLLWQRHSTNSATNIVSNDTIMDDDMMLFRWKIEDGIVFGKPNCDPISPYVASLTPGMELYDLKHQTRLGQSKYILPLMGGMLAGIMSFKEGINKTKADNVGLGVPLIIVGTAVFTCSIVLPITISKHSRGNKVERYNDAQMQKLETIYAKRYGY